LISLKVIDRYLNFLTVTLKLVELLHRNEGRLIPFKFWEATVITRQSLNLWITLNFFSLSRKGFLPLLLPKTFSEIFPLFKWVNILI
jgi:hypothetical protein